MKFKASIAVSVVLHILLFSLAFFVPANGNNKDTKTYYVDLISMSGSGSGGGGGKSSGNSQAKTTTSTGTELRQPPAAQNQRMKDLTAKKEEPKSTLRYQDDRLNKTKPKKGPVKKEEPKKKEFITVVKNDQKQKTVIDGTTDGKSTGKSSGQSALPGNVLKTGISSGGSGGGTGGGVGSGSGGRFGAGSGIGGFPYAYYIEAIRSKISSSWYSALVSPGVRGKLVAGVYFKILRNGKIQDLELETKSGNTTLDLSALRAIENAAPFPPLPQDYPDTALVVHFEFEWEKK